MKVGDRITFQFGGKEKTGTVVKVFPKTVYLKADFPRHPGKILARKLAELEGKRPPKRQGKKAKPQTKKEKVQPPKAEEKKEEKVDKKEE